MTGSPAEDATRVLVLHSGLRHGTPNGHQALPFVRYCARLSDHRVACELVRVDRDDDRRAGAVERYEPDVVIDFRHWSESEDAARAGIERVRSVRPWMRYVLMDWSDPTCSPHLGLIGDVDVFAKRQALADRGAYAEEYAGGFIVTDYLVREMGFELNGWTFGVRASRDDAERIEAVWNLGAVSRYERLARSSRLQLPRRLRPIDVHSRLGMNPDKPNKEWYERYRLLGLETLHRYGKRLRVAWDGRVPTKRYFAELLASKTVFSPFGWGEVCFRDYEAVACGCLLLKQDMSHLKTEPDIYRPMETYVPIRWDLSDLHERLDWISRHPRDANAIALNGQRALRRYFDDGGPTRTMLDLVTRATGDG